MMIRTKMMKRMSMMRNEDDADVEEDDEDP